MGKFIQAIVVCIFLLLCASLTQGADVDVGININLGNKPSPPPPPPPPPHNHDIIIEESPDFAYPPTPMPPPEPMHQVIIEEPPEFIYPSSLGFYVAVGIPYDLFYFNNQYYMYRDNVWYISNYYNGPWGKVQYNYLPQKIREHRHSQIIMIRDEEYRNYQRERHQYRGRYFRPDKHEMKEMRKQDKEAWKEEKKHHKHHEDED